MVLHLNSEFNFNLFLRLCLDGLWWPGRWMFPQRYFLADSLCWSDFQPSVCLLSLWVMQALHSPPPSVGFRRTESWKRQHILEREKLASESIKALSQCSFVYIYVSCWVVSCSCTAGIPLIRQHIEIFQQVPQSNSPPQLTAGTSFLITSSRLQFSSLPAAQCEKSRPLSGNKFPWMEAVLPSHDRRRSCNKLTAASSSQLLHPAWLL